MRNSTDGEARGITCNEPWTNMYETMYECARSKECGPKQSCASFHTKNIKPHTLNP